MTRIAWLCYVFCAVVAGGFIVATTAGMPSDVASHFGLRNAANGFMTRSAYLIFMLAFGLGLPAFVAGMIAFLPRVRPDAINIPNRAYWLDPPGARRRSTRSAQAAPGSGALLTLFIAGVHYVVVEANWVTPPELPAGMFFALITIFVAVLALWIVSPTSASAIRGRRRASRRRPAHRWPTRRRSCSGSTRTCGPSSSGSRRPSCAASTHRLSSCCVMP
jgi:hypothetical protein